MSDQPQEFAGFPRPEQNYSKLPHILIDALPLMQSEAEIKCVLYLLRHTWGFSEYDMPKQITLDEFMDGRKRKDGTRLDKGTGLSKPSVIKGLRAAEKHGFITIAIGDDSDGGRVEKLYCLNMRNDPLPLGSIPFTPDVKVLYPSEEFGKPSQMTSKESLQAGKESLHRSEKETLKKETRTKDKSTAPQNGADSAPASRSENAEKKPPTRSPMFVAVAAEVFQIYDTASIAKNLVIAINKVVRWLNENSPGATADTLKAFASWYDNKYSGAARPQGEDKFAKHFTAFKQQHLASNGARRTAPPPEIPAAIYRTPEELAELKAIKERALAAAQESAS